MALHEIWPEAPIFVLFHDKKKITNFTKADVRESFLSKFPFGRARYQWYLPWMPLATESHDLKDFDVVISTSSMFAKGIITGPQTLHISYCHTPARFLWADNYRYIADLKTSRFIKTILPGLLHRLRLWDRMSVDRVDHFVANSKTVQKRIGKYYRRDSEVIYPPVETHLFAPAEKVDDYFVAGGRLVPYKRLDLVIKTFNRLRWPLKIFGAGPEFYQLRRMAKPNIEFLGFINDEDKARLLSHTKAYINPQIEDFGITAIESMGSGRPVIAYSQGGATETVIPNETGVFFHKQTWGSLLDTVLRFNHENWDSRKIWKHAQQFNADGFKSKIKQYVRDKQYVGDRLVEFNGGLRQGVLNDLVVESP